MEINLSKVQTITLFVIAFLVIGYAAPIVFVAFSPEDRFVDVHSFQAADTYTDAETHNVCFNRTVNRPTDVDITVEVILLQENVTVEKSSYEVDAYYQKSSEPIIIERQLPDNLEAGTYQYVHNVEASYFVNNVEKNIQFRSDSFTVHENRSQLDAEYGVIRC